MEAIEETMTEVQPVAPAEPEVSKEVTTEVKTEAVVVDGPPTDPAALDEWAVGRAMRLRPELFQQPQTTQAAVEHIPGHPGVPMHPNYAKWVEEGNQDAIDAYVGAVKASQVETSRVEEKVDKMSAQYGRNQTILEAAQNLQEDVKPYMKKAVENIEAMNGSPIPGHNPIMVRVVENEARRLYMDAGGHIKKTPVGETVPGGSSEPQFPRAVLDAEKKVFEDMGMKGVTDAFVIQHLKEQGAVPI